VRHLLLSFAVLASPALAAEKQPCEPNPLFTPFPGETVEACERNKFSQLQLWGWKKEGDPKSGAQPFKVEGEFWSYRASLAKDAKGQFPATLEIQRNFEGAVTAANGVLNLSLSKARAGAVVDALVKQYGVKKERLVAEGVGSYAPLSNNTSDAGRAKNRRVEMVLR
jgi:hypothetical protein